MDTDIKFIKPIDLVPLSNGGMAVIDCKFCQGTGKIINKWMTGKEKCPKCEGQGNLLIPRIK